MKRFLIGSEAHDDACRAILRNSSMGKDIRLSLQREPSFFPAEKIANTWSQFVVLEDDETKTVLGFAARSGRSYWLQGRPAELGYISQLRLVPEFRNGLYLAKGYRKFKEMHDADRKVPFYLTTIFSENSVARQILESGRGGLPLYRPITELSSFFFTARRAPRTVRADVSDAPAADVLAAYNTYTATSSLATRYDEQTLSWLSLVAHRAITVRSDTFTASAILVDFSNVKQLVIDGYSPSYTALTTLARVAAPLLGIRPPPKAGSELKCSYMIAASFSGDKNRGFQALLAHARDKAYEDNQHGVVYGQSAHSSFTSHARRACMSTTKSMLYAVAWDARALPAIDSSMDSINVEVALL